MPTLAATLAREVPDTEKVSLDSIFRSHASDVNRWAAWLGGARVDPDDVVQEVFLVVRRRLDDFRGEGLRPWLFRITANVVSNLRRRAWFRRIWREDCGAVSEHPISEKQWPDAGIDVRERVALLHTMLQALPERERQVLVLFELEEMSGAEIAAFLDVPAATVRVWLHRARKALVKRVKPLIAAEAP